MKGGLALSKGFPGKYGLAIYREQIRRCCPIELTQDPKPTLTKSLERLQPLENSVLTKYASIVVQKERTSLENTFRLMAKLEEPNWDPLLQSELSKGPAPSFCNFVRIPGPSDPSALVYGEGALDHMFQNLKQ